MRIAYLGNFSQSHCTEVHLANTLEQLGHSVDRIQENEPLPAWFDLALGADIFLFTRTWGETLTIDHLKRLSKAGVPTVSYHLDLYVGLQRKYLHQSKTLDEMLQTDPFWNTDFVFTPDGDPESQKVFQRNGVRHHYIKPGVYKPECLMFVPSTEQIDVLFVGGGDRPGSTNGYGHPEWPYRDKLIGWLYDTYGDRFQKFGHPQPTIRNDELNQLYANSKIVIGDSVCLPDGEFTHEHYWSDRVYETIGRGGFMIHPYIKGLEEEFEDGETIVFYEYGNFDQLKEKIDYYLEHDEEREKIRNAGFEFVRDNATYEDRMRYMVSYVGAHSGMDAKKYNGYYTQAKKKPIKINLGAGSEPTEGWINTDWIEAPGIQEVFNLLEFPWPFANGVASEIKAIDVLEHMPPFNADNDSTPIRFVEECHRILQTGGKLTLQVPHWQSPRLWIDPTHVRGYDPQSFDYFDPEKDYGKWYGYYSECKFKVDALQQYFADDNDVNVKHKGNITFTMVKR